MDELKSAPRGYPKDHPRIELLRRKGLMMSRAWAPASWLHTKQVASKVRKVWTDAAPMCEWLNRWVGTVRPAAAGGVTLTSSVG